MIYWNNFLKHWNKRHMGFEQSFTNNLSPGNGVVRSPGDEVITFVPGLDCASTRETWVNRQYDYKDGRLWEWRKCFLIIVYSLARKKNYGENFQYQENICEIGSAGSCCSNREPLDQIRRVGMFACILYMYCMYKYHTHYIVGWWND